MPMPDDEKWNSFWRDGNKRREAKRDVIAAMEGLRASIAKLHTVYVEHPELNEMQPLSMEKTIPMSIDEWESQAGICLEDWQKVDVDVKKEPSAPATAKAEAPSAQELLDALNVYQKVNRLKHDGDFELFEAAEPLIERAVKAGLTVKSFREVMIQLGWK